MRADFCVQMTAVDLFAGLGGFTQGAESAGCSVVWAANHWPIAVEYHRRNHPGTAHACQDLRQFDFRLVPDHDLALCSPCCQGHSRAARKRPSHDASRATAWAVVSLLEAKRPRFALVENVEEFQRWALFPAWSLAAESLGYSIAPHLLDAADAGVPQHRRRLFLVLSRSRAPLRLSLQATEHRPVSEVIRWDAYPWSLVAHPGRSRKTLDRVAAGRREHGDCFVMPYYGSGSGQRGRSIHRPLGTVTTRARWAVVRGDQMRMLQPEELREAMSFPDTYSLPANKALATHLLGNAVCPLQAKALVEALRRVA